MHRYSAVLASSLLVLVGQGCAKHEEAPVAEMPVGGGGGALASSYSAPADLVAGGNCALDAVAGISSGEARPKSGETVVFAGWLGDADGEVPEQAHLVLTGDGGAFQFAVRAGDHRPDVSAALGRPGLEWSGYNALVSLADVPAGSYRTSFVMDGTPPTECLIGSDVVIE